MILKNDLMCLKQALERLLWETMPSVRSDALERSCSREVEQWIELLPRSGRRSGGRMVYLIQRERTSSQPMHQMMAPMIMDHLVPAVLDATSSS